MHLISFASPWFLAGLASLVVPFLLLMTKAHVKRTTQFSSVQFLWAITQHASNVIEWKRILLLVVRLLLLALMAGAFALPFVNKMGFTLGGALRPHYIFILDNSYGMGYAEPGKPTLFERAKQQALSQAKSADRNALWSVYLFNETLQSVLQRSDSRDEFVKTVSGLHESSFASNFSLLLPGIKEMLSAPGFSRNTVKVLSDFSIADPKLGDEILKELEKDKLFSRVYLVPVQPGEFRNLSLSRVIMPPRPLLPGAEESILLAYESTGMKAGNEADVSLFVEDQPAASARIKLDETGKGFVKFRYVFPATGNFPLRFQAAQDGLLADNARYAMAVVHQPLKLLLIEDEITEFPFDNAYYYFSQALESYSTDSGQPWIHFERIPLENLKDLDLSSYDIVVSANVFRYRSQDFTQIRKYVEKGGIFLFAGGPSYVPEQNNNGREMMNGLLGGYFGGIEQSADGKPAYRMETIDYGQPLLKIFEEGRKGDLSSIKFDSFLRFFPVVPGDEYEVLLWFAQKWPALIERRLGNGRVFIWTTSLNHAWTTFPKNPLFVPFVFELLKYADPNQAGIQRDQRVGEALSLKSLSGKMEQIVIKKPDGEQITLKGGLASAIDTFPTDIPGIYFWYGEGNGQSFDGSAAFNLDTRESQPSYKMIDERTAPSSPRGEDVATAEKAAREMDRSFLYRPVLYTILLFILMETWLANRFYKPQWV